MTVEQDISDIFGLLSRLDERLDVVTQAAIAWTKN